MHKVVPYEFFIGKRNGTSWLTGLLSPCRESDLCCIHRNDPAVGNSYLVRILTEIFNRIPKSIESFLDVRAPFLFVKFVFNDFPAGRVFQGSTAGRKYDLIAMVKLVQKGGKLSLETYPEGQTKG